MKILVGILHCNENELPVCVESLRNQSYSNFEYFEVGGLPNKLGHDTLYSKFMEQAQTCDVFVKVDGDMVLCRRSFLEEVAQRFAKEPDIDDLQIGVHDFFTDRLIYGLHAYSNRVQWPKTNERIFVDMVDKRKKRVQDMDDLAPAAYHCPNPSPFQAYHFGIHKAVKVTQIGSENVNHHNRRVHLDNILEIRKQWHKRRDRRLGLALMGAVTAFEKEYTFEQVDYSNPQVREFFAQFEGLSADDLERLEAELAPLFQSLESCLAPAP